MYAKAKPYLENEWVQKSTGFKTLPETINGAQAASLLPCAAVVVGDLWRC